VILGGGGDLYNLGLGWNGGGFKCKNNPPVPLAIG